MNEGHFQEKRESVSVNNPANRAHQFANPPVHFFDRSFVFLQLFRMDCQPACLLLERPRLTRLQLGGDCDRVPQFFDHIVVLAGAALQRSIRSSIVMTSNIVHYFGFRSYTRSGQWQSRFSAMVGNK